MLMDRAKELGQGLGRSEEYQALQRAISAADDDREFQELRSELASIEERLEAAVRAGEEPSQELQNEYGQVLERVQVNGVYQRLVAAQANFEKLMTRVNGIIAEGMKEGGQSRIVLPS